LGSKAKNIRLQKAAKSSKDNLPWALVAGVFLAALLAATIRWPGDLRVSGSLVAEAVSIVADDGIRIDPDLVIDKQVNIVGLTSLEPPPEIKRDSVASKNVTLHAPQLSLASLSISPGTDVTFDSKAAASGVKPWLLSQNGSISLQFEATGPLSIDADSQTLSTDVTNDPLPVVVTSAKATKAFQTLSVFAKTSGSFSLGDLPSAPGVSLLRFGRRSSTSDQSTAFVSTIVSGSVSLVDVSHEEQLKPNAALQLERFKGHLTELRATPDGFRVGFSGTVSRLKIGPSGFAEDITPSSLEYLYHQEWIKLIWVVAAGLLAGLIKVRSWMSGKPQGAD
jgi:hypothetical protein